MSNAEIIEKLAEMTRDMEFAAEQRNKRLEKIYHKTNPQSWEQLKMILGYQEPPGHELAR